jgi:transcriptional regulator GlxA family with amidase domain
MIVTIIFALPPLVRLFEAAKIDIYDVSAVLMLHLIGRAHGQDLATEGADQMVLNAVREGTAARRVSVQSRHGMRNEHRKRAIAIMEGALI